MFGHTEIVWAATFVADDKNSECSNDHRIRVWDGDVGQPFSEPLRGHAGPITSVAINSAGDLIASGSADKTVRHWDLHTGKHIGTPLVGHTGVVTSVAFSRNRRRVASGSADGTIRLWRTDSHNFVNTLNADSLCTQSPSARSDQLASAGDNCTIKCGISCLGQLNSAAVRRPQPRSCCGVQPPRSTQWRPAASTASCDCGGQVRDRCSGERTSWIPSRVRSEPASIWRPDVPASSPASRLAPTDVTSRREAPYGDPTNPERSHPTLGCRKRAARGEPMHPLEGSAMAVAFSPPAGGKASEPDRLRRFRQPSEVVGCGFGYRETDGWTPPRTSKRRCECGIHLGRQVHCVRQYGWDGPDLAQPSDRGARRRIA